MIGSPEIVHREPTAAQKRAQAFIKGYRLAERGTAFDDLPLPEDARERERMMQGHIAWQNVRDGRIPKWEWER